MAKWAKRVKKNNTTKRFWNLFVFFFFCFAFRLELNFQIAKWRQRRRQQLAFGCQCQCIQTKQQQQLSRCIRNKTERNIIEWCCEQDARQRRPKYCSFRQYRIQRSIFNSMFNGNATALKWHRDVYVRQHSIENLCLFCYSYSQQRSANKTHTRILQGRSVHAMQMKVV